MDNYKNDGRRIAELVTVIIFSLDEIFMMMRTVIYEWGYLSSLILLASLLGIVGVYLSKYRTLHHRAVIYSSIMSMSMFVHVIQMDSFMPIIIPTATFIIVLAVLGEILALLPALFGFMLTIFYHGIVVSTFGIHQISDLYTYIVPIGNILFCFYLAYIWIKCRNQNEENIKNVISRYQKAERTKDDFLANISHEIRTPINTIAGMSEILANEDLRDDVREKVQDLQGASRNLVTLVSDMLDFAEIQSGKLELSESSYNLTSTINDIVNIINNQKKNKDIEFILDINTDIPALLVGDEQKLKRAMLNILSNAVKFTEVGCVVLEISCRRESYGINLCITVRDTGIGIDSSQLHNVFNSFSMVDTKRNRQEGGVGLGLAIAQAIIEKMGGFISVRSRKGEGSEFQIIVPQKVERYEPMIVLENPQRFNVLVYIDMNQFSIAAVKNEYGNNIRNITKNLDIVVHVCRNLNELKRRIERNYITHIFITLYEYTMDESYFNELAKHTGVVIILEETEAYRVHSDDIIRLYKPFYALPVSIILKGGKRYNNLNREAMNKNMFIAPDAKILIVDDNVINLRVESCLMKNYKFTIDTALSGMEALEKLESKDYDMVFMDHMMPEMDGVDTLHRIRDKAGIYYANIPVIALTANAVAGAKEMLIAEGFQDFLSKPVEIASMHRILEKYLPDAKKIYDFEDDATDVQSGEAVHNDHEHEIVYEQLQNPQASVNEPGAETAQEDTAADINEKQGTLYCGSLEDFEDILKIHYEDYEENSQKIQAFYDSKDWKNYVILVHGLKSSMKSVGIMKLSDMCLELEIAGKENRIDYILKNHDAMMAEYARIHDVIGNRLGIRQKVNVDLTNVKNLDEDSLAGLLNQFENAVYSFDEEQMLSILNELMDYKYHETVLAQKLYPLVKKVNNCDYMSAYDNLIKIFDKTQKKGV